MMTTSPDGDLVLAYSREGSEAAFRALVNRHVNLVYGTALRQVGDAGMAEEISQNVFVALARKAPRLGGNQTLAGWLHRTTILEAKARIRAELRRQRRDQAAAELAFAEREGASASDALAPLLDEGLLNLREADRMALVLRFLEQRSLRDVGEVLGVDEDAARKRVTRALEKLTQFFRKRGFAAAGAVAAALESSGGAAAPASLLVSASQAGATAAASAGTGAFAIILNSAMNAKAALACALIAAVPLTIQWSTHAKLRQEHSAVTRQLQAAQIAVEEFEGRIRDARQAAIDAQTENANMEARLAAVRSQIERRSPAPAYGWDDNSPVFRIPKEFLAYLDVSVFRNRQGILTTEITELLQLTTDELARVEAALAGFLTRYHAAETPNIRPVSPSANDLQGHAADEVRVFEIAAIGEPLKQMRAELLTELKSILGPDRYAIFQRGLGQWMPLDDDYHGMNSMNTVFNSDRRLRFYKPRPPHRSEDLEYSIDQPGRGLMNIRMFLDEIPPGLRPHLEDWIALVRRSSTSNGKSDE